MVRTTHLQAFYVEDPYWIDKKTNEHTVWGMIGDVIAEVVGTRTEWEEGVPKNK